MITSIDISLNLIMKDEEKNLERCLKLTKEVVNEIIIVDSGSKDRSKEIAKDFGAEIIDYPKDKEFDFSTARNIALRNSFGKYILQLDADEELNKPEGIWELIEDNLNAYIFKIVNLINWKGVTTSWEFDSIRLFKNHPEIKYNKYCHEQIYPSMLKLDYELKDPNQKIIHWGYLEPEKTLREKFKRNIKLLEREYQDFNHYLTAMQLSDSYSGIGDQIKADYFLNKVISDKRCPMHIKNKLQNLDFRLN